jgi:hypothetical protein
MDHFELLNKLYFDISQPSGFGGINRLASKAKEYGINRSEVVNFLKQTKEYTLHKPRRINFKRNRIIVRDKFEQYQVDLVDLLQYKSQNDGYAYLLTAIDCLTKYAYAIPIKNKNDSSVHAAFEKMFRQRTPMSVQFDKGTFIKF